MSRSSLRPYAATIRSTGQTRAGLDIGAHSAKLVVCQFRQGRSRVVRASCYQIEPTGNDAAALTRQLWPWLQEYGESGCRSIIGGLPSSTVDYEAIELPAEHDGDLEPFVESALERILGDGRQQASADYWTNSAGGTPGQVLHLAWTGSEFAAELAKGLARGGLRWIALDAPAAALARLTSLSPDLRTDGLIADIGSGEVTLVWSREGIAQYVRNRIRFSAASAPGVLATALAVRPTAAEELLTSCGLGLSTARNVGPLERLVQRQLSEWLDHLKFEMRRTIQFLRHRWGPSAVSQIILCGGGSCLRGLSEWLHGQLRLPVCHARLPVDWTWDAATPYSPRFAQAVALAQYGESG